MLRTEAIRIVPPLAGACATKRSTLSQTLSDTTQCEGLHAQQPERILVSSFASTYSAGSTMSGFMSAQKLELIDTTKAKLRLVADIDSRAEQTGLQLTDACVERYCDVAKWKNKMSKKKKCGS